MHSWHRKVDWIEKKKCHQSLFFVDACPEENTSEKYYKEFVTSSGFLCPFTSEAAAVPSSPLVLLWFPRPVSAFQPVLSNMLIPICFQRCLSVSTIHSCFYFICSQCVWQHLFSPFAQILSPSPLISRVLRPCFTSVSPPCFVVGFFFPFSLLVSLPVSLGPDLFANLSVIFNHNLKAVEPAPWETREPSTQRGINTEICMHAYAHGLCNHKHKTHL